MRKKQIALELASVNEKLDNFGTKRKANKLKCLEKKHGHTCKTNSLKKRTSNKKIYAKKKKRNKSVSMPAKHSMRQRCKKELHSQGADTERLQNIANQLGQIEQELSFIKNTQH